MKYCEYCDSPIGETPRRNFCSESCYQKDYYYKNKERRTLYYKQYNKEHYVPHPLPRKSPEEILQRRRDYYQAHKEYYKERNANYYQTHKNDPHYRERIRRTQRAYYERKKNNAIHT